MKDAVKRGRAIQEMCQPFGTVLTSGIDVIVALVGNYSLQHNVNKAVYKTLNDLGIKDRKAFDDLEAFESALYSLINVGEPFQKNLKNGDFSKWEELGKMAKSLRKACSALLTLAAAIETIDKNLN